MDRGRGGCCDGESLFREDCCDGSVWIYETEGVTVFVLLKPKVYNHLEVIVVWTLELHLFVSCENKFVDRILNSLSVTIINSSVFGEAPASNIINLLGSVLMGNIVNTVRRFSRNSADAVPFRRYSSLSNGTPSTRRLDKCTCDKDSSVAGKTASPVNNGANGCESVFKEVDNETMGLTTCSSSRSGCFTPSGAHTEPSGGDEANKRQRKSHETIHTDAIEHGSVSRPDSAGLICNRTAHRMLHNLENGSTQNIRRLTAVISEDHFSTVSPEENYSTDSMVAEGVIKNPARDTHKFKELRLHSVSPGSNLFDRDAYEKLIDDDLYIGFKSIPEASVNRETVPFEDSAVCDPLDVRGSESSPKASSKGRAKRKRTNPKASAKIIVPSVNVGTSASLDVKYSAVCGPLDVRDSESSPKASSKRLAKRKRTNPEASAKIIVPTGNVGTLASPDVKYPEMVRSPLTRSKAKALSVSTLEYNRLRSTRMGHLVIPPSDPGSRNIICGVAKLPVIPFVEQSSADDVLQLSPLMIRTPLPHVRSSLTPSKAQVLSVPTLKNLQLRSSRSGRVIVPSLDPGTQSITYDADGSIRGVTNSELQQPRGCDSEPPAKRRRKSQCPSRYLGRSLQFDGNSGL